jgi:hypothetical protein
MGHAGITETAPGSSETHRPTATMNSIPQAVKRSGHASSPMGIRKIDNAALGITTKPIIGIANKLPRTA